VRTSVILVGLALAACGGARVTPAPHVAPRASFVGYRGDEHGCIYGDCVTGRFARRVDGRVVSGVVEEAERLVEWEESGCRGWSYRGPVVDDLPDGDGQMVSSTSSGVAFDFHARFERGAIAGRVTGIGRLASHRRVHFEGELRFRTGSCQLTFANPTSTVVRDLTIRGTARGDAEFRGVVLVRRSAFVLWRGRLVSAQGESTKTGYVDEVDDEWSLTMPSVCVRGDCISGDGVEIFGGANLHVYTGRFEDGAREGHAVVDALDADGAKSYQATYAGGHVVEAALVRPAYRIEPESAGGGAVPWIERSAARTDQAIAPRTFWTGNTLQWITPREIGSESIAALGFPPAMPAPIAAVAVLLRDVPRGVAQVRCIAECDTTVPTYVATDGARTPFIARATDADGAPGQIAAVWRPDHQQFLTGVVLLADDLGRLIGTADLDGKHVVFAKGTRVDTLGYKTLVDYAAATAKDRAARAVKAAKKAARARAMLERTGPRLNRVLDGAGTALSMLAVAKESIARDAADGPAYERVIREAHAAVERAASSALDATAQIAAALGDLDSGDPCVDPLANAGALLRDLDERLHVLLVAFEAFEYSEDVDRLAAIAWMLGDGLGSIRTVDLDATYAQLRAAIGGAPQPLPEP
jgi:hypothetical protein